MSKQLSIILVAFFVAQGVWAATTPVASDCASKAISKTGKPLYGAAKAASIKKCESAHDPAVTMPDKSAQQNKMATCNKEAKSKKGAERKTFMKDCLTK